MGAWIETYNYQGRGNGLKVAPYRCAWIETPLIITEKSRYKVAPYCNYPSKKESKSQLKYNDENYYLRCCKYQLKQRKQITTALPQLQQMDKQIEKISHGALFKGTISNIGAAICVVSIALFFTSIHFLIPLVTLILGFIPFMSIELIEIDYGQRRIRKALNLIFYKHGEWMPLDDFDKLVFGANHESLKMVMPAHPIMQKDINLRFYDIYIVNKNNPKKTLLFMSCNSIQEGQRKLEEYSSILNIEMIDTIKEGWEKIRNRRR